MGSTIDAPELDVKRLKVGRLIGRGAFAQVYTASYDGRECALKVLAPAARGPVPPVYEKLFLAEAALCSSFKHRHVLECHGLLRIPAGHPSMPWLTAPAWAMALQLCEAATLREAVIGAMALRRAYGDGTALEWLRGVAEALHALHTANPTVIHRVVKADNVLLKKGADGRIEVKLGDLGLHVKLEEQRSVMLRRRGGSRASFDGNLPAFVAITPSVMELSGSVLSGGLSSRRGARPAGRGASPEDEELRSRPWVLETGDFKEEEDEMEALHLELQADRDTAAGVVPELRSGRSLISKKTSGRIANPSSLGIAGCEASAQAQMQGADSPRAAPPWHQAATTAAGSPLGSKRNFQPCSSATPPLHIAVSPRSAATSQDQTASTRVASGFEPSNSTTRWTDGRKPEECFVVKPQVRSSAPVVLDAHILATVAAADRVACAPLLPHDSECSEVGAPVAAANAPAAPVRAALRCSELGAGPASWGKHDGSNSPPASITLYAASSGPVSGHHTSSAGLGASRRISAGNGMANSTSTSGVIGVSFGLMLVGESPPALAAAQNMLTALDRVAPSGLSDDGTDRGSPETLVCRPAGIQAGASFGPSVPTESLPGFQSGADSKCVAGGAASASQSGGLAVSVDRSGAGWGKAVMERRPILGRCCSSHAGTIAGSASTATTQTGMGGTTASTTDGVMSSSGPLREMPSGLNSSASKTYVCAAGRCPHAAASEAAAGVGVVAAGPGPLLTPAPHEPGGAVKLAVAATVVTSMNGPLGAVESKEVELDGSGTDPSEPRQPIAASCRRVETGRVGGPAAAKFSPFTFSPAAAGKSSGFGTMAADASPPSRPLSPLGAASRDPDGGARRHTGQLREAGCAVSESTASPGRPASSSGASRTRQAGGTHSGTSQAHAHRRPATMIFEAGPLHSKSSEATQLKSTGTDWGSSCSASIETGTSLLRAGGPSRDGPAEKGSAHALRSRGPSGRSAAVEATVDASGSASGGASSLRAAADRAGHQAWIALPAGRNVRGATDRDSCPSSANRSPASGVLAAAARMSNNGSGASVISIGVIQEGNFLGLFNGGTPDSSGNAYGERRPRTASNLARIASTRHRASSSASRLKRVPDSLSSAFREYGALCDRQGSAPLPRIVGAGMRAAGTNSGNAAEQCIIMATDHGVGDLADGPVAGYCSSPEDSGGDGSDGADAADKDDGFGGEDAVDPSSLCSPHIEVSAKSLSRHLRRIKSITALLNTPTGSQLPQHEDFEWVFGLTGRAGSCMYIAPEVLMGEPYNEKVDVFSFGCLAYEVLARELLLVAYINTSRGAAMGVKTAQDYARKVSQGYRPPRPVRHVTDAQWELITMCWDPDPCERPSMAEVRQRIDAMLSKVTEEDGPGDATGSSCPAACGEANRTAPQLQSCGCGCTIS